MLAWLTFVKFEEDDPLEPRSSTLSWRDHLFWDLPSHLLVLGRIPISKWGLRPNIKVQAFAPTIYYYYLVLIRIVKSNKNHSYMIRLFPLFYDLKNSLPMLLETFLWRNTICKSWKLWVYCGKMLIIEKGDD